MTPPSVVTIGSSDMKLSAVLILVLNAFCTFSYIPHELNYFVGCFVNGTSEVQFNFDAEEIYYADLQNNKIIYTVPVNIDPDPKTIWASLELRDILENVDLCLAYTTIADTIEKNPPEEQDPPESILYPSEEVELGVENLLICFVNHFYPPSINVSWTKNGYPVSEGVSLSRYYPNNDQTFHQFSTLTFTPTEGDIYSCTVEHQALEAPTTQFWEAEVTDRNIGPDVFCRVSLALGLLMVAAAVFLIAKAQKG